jgi:hypothetical protein
MAPIEDGLSVPTINQSSSSMSRIPIKVPGRKANRINQSTILAITADTNRRLDDLSVAYQSKSRTGASYAKGSGATNRSMTNGV